MLTLTTPIQQSTGSPSQCNQARKIKSIQIGKDKIKLSLFADDILLRENPKMSNKKMIDLINKFSNVAEYKINIQKTVALLFANNKLSEKRKQSHL